MNWAEDLDETTVRYGMPESRIRGMGAMWSNMIGAYYYGPTYGVADIISHYSMPGLDLLPPVDGLRPGSGNWDRPSSWPRAGYSLAVDDSLASWLPSLTHQT
jgi:hypothetical protein